jgi:hypothetical protein
MNAGRRGAVTAPLTWLLPSTAFAVLLGVCAPSANCAQWYRINDKKGECERASRTEYPSPDDYMDYLQKQNQYRSKEVSRDFTGRAQIVTVTDSGNHQMTFYVDEDSCQLALRRQQRIGGSARAR